MLNDSLFTSGTHVKDITHFEVYPPDCGSESDHYGEILRAVWRLLKKDNINLRV